MRYFFLALSLLGGIFAQAQWLNVHLELFRVSKLPVQGIFLVLVCAVVYSQLQSLGRPGRELRLSLLDASVASAFVWLVSSLQGGLAIHFAANGGAWTWQLGAHWLVFCVPPFLYIFKGAKPWAFAIYALPVVFEFGKLALLTKSTGIVLGPKQPVVVLALVWAICGLGSALWVWRSNNTKDGRQMLKRQEIRLREDPKPLQPVPAPAPEMPLNRPEPVVNENILSSKVSNFIKLATIDPIDAEYQSVFEKISGLLIRVMRHGTLHTFFSKDKGQTFELMTWVDKKSYHSTLDQAVIHKGQGPIGNFIETDEIITHGDQLRFPGQDRTLEYYSDNKDIGSIMLKVIKDPVTHEPVGLLVLDRMPQEGLFDDDDLRMLREIVEIASQMIVSLNRAIKLKEDEKQTKALYECSKMMLKKLKYNEILDDLFLEMNNAFQAERMLYIKPDPATRKGRILKVYGVPMPGLETKSNGVTYALTEDQHKFEQSLFSLTSSDKGFYANALMSTKSFSFQTGKKGFRFREDLKDDLEFGMVGYIKLEKSLFATIGVERSKPFSLTDLVIFRNFLMLATSAIEKAHSFAEREKQATVDVLTGIANHRYFQETMDTNLVKAQANSANVTLLLMDIDFFKKFNDTYGHQIGDQVLRSVAQALSGSIRKGVDFVARYGGEEFIVILPGLDAAQSLRSAERIRLAVESMSVDTVKGPLKVTISIGAASYSVDAQSKTELIEKADEALYHCKGRGRNCITIWRNRDESWRGQARGTNENPFEMAPAASGGIPH